MGTIKDPHNKDPQQLFDSHNLTRRHCDVKCKGSYMYSCARLTNLHLDRVYTNIVQHTGPGRNRQSCGSVTCAWFCFIFTSFQRLDCGAKTLISYSYSFIRFLLYGDPIFAVRAGQFSQCFSGALSLSH